MEERLEVKLFAIVLHLHTDSPDEGLLFYRPIQLVLGGQTLRNGRPLHVDDRPDAPEFVSPTGPSLVDCHGGGNSKVHSPTTAIFSGTPVAVVYQQIPPERGKQRNTGDYSGNKLVAKLRGGKIHTQTTHGLLITAIETSAVGVVGCRRLLCEFVALQYCRFFELVHLPPLRPGTGRRELDRCQARQPGRFRSLSLHCRVHCPLSDGTLVGGSPVPRIFASGTGPAARKLYVGDVFERDFIFHPPPVRAGLFAAVCPGLDLGDSLY